MRRHVSHLVVRLFQSLEVQFLPPFVEGVGKKHARVDVEEDVATIRAEFIVFVLLFFLFDVHVEPLAEHVQNVALVDVLQSQKIQVILVGLLVSVQEVVEHDSNGQGIFFIFAIFFEVGWLDQVVLFIDLLDGGGHPGVRRASVFERLDPDGTAL